MQVEYSDIRISGRVKFLTRNPKLPAYWSWAFPLRVISFPNDVEEDMPNFGILPRLIKCLC